MANHSHKCQENNYDQQWRDKAIVLDDDHSLLSPALKAPKWLLGKKSVLMSGTGHYDRTGWNPHGNPIAEVARTKSRSLGFSNVHKIGTKVNETLKVKCNKEKNGGDKNLNFRDMSTEMDWFSAVSTWQLQSVLFWSWNLQKKWNGNDLQ